MKKVVHVCANIDYAVDWVIGLFGTVKNKSKYTAIGKVT